MTYGFVIPSNSLGPVSWWGSMANMKQNATGGLDMRNRVYDPKSGRFTQEDPIGLAGGMNLYGFANGDAVNYSDPFGLCVGPLIPVCTRIAILLLARALPAVAIAGGASTGLVAGSLRNVNPGFPAIGRVQNCVNCAIATDALLHGRPASALPGGPTNLSVLENMYGGKFEPMGSTGAITEALKKAGSGATAIIFGSRGPNQVGHVFNAVNQNGVIRFLDGQTGREAVTNGFNALHMLRTP
jgi:RHS repeat-associated protein